jgi:hypothetical protein
MLFAAVHESAVAGEYCPYAIGGLRQTALGSLGFAILLLLLCNFNRPPQLWYSDNESNDGLSVASCE